MLGQGGTKVARSDAELVQRARAGDREAFGMLVERHRRTVFVMAVQRGYDHDVAEDVAQEVFLKAYQHLENLGEPEAFARWLYGIAHHAISDQGRKRVRRREFSGLEQAPEPAETGDAAGDLERNETRRQVFKALDDLNEEQRLVVMLRYIEGLSPREIAERLAEPRGTIRSRLHHALSFLQAALGDRTAHLPVREERAP